MSVRALDCWTSNHSKHPFLENINHLHLLGWWMWTWQEFLLYLMLSNLQQLLHRLYIFCNSRQVFETVESSLNHRDAPSLLASDLSKIPPNGWAMRTGPSQLSVALRRKPESKPPEGFCPQLDSVPPEGLWWEEAVPPRITDKTTGPNPRRGAFHQELCWEIRQIFFYQVSEWKKEPIKIILLGRLLVFLLLVHLFHGNCYL